MTDNTQAELDEIFDEYIANAGWASRTGSSQDYTRETLQQAILDWHNKQIDEATDSVEAMVADIEFKAGINHVTMSGEWIHIDEVNKQIESVLEKEHKEHEICCRN